MSDATAGSAPASSVQIDGADAFEAAAWLLNLDADGAGEVVGRVYQRGPASAFVVMCAWADVVLAAIGPEDGDERLWALLAGPTPAAGAPAAVDKPAAPRVRVQADAIRWLIWWRQGRQHHRALALMGEYMQAGSPGPLVELMTTLCGMAARAVAEEYERAAGPAPVSSATEAIIAVADAMVVAAAEHAETGQSDQGGDQGGETNLLRRDPRMMDLARTALHAQIDGDTDAAIAALQEISHTYGGYGLSALIMLLVDTFIAAQRPPDASPHAMIRIAWQQAETGTITGPDGVRVEAVWAGRLISARAADDQDGYRALLDALPADPQVIGDHVYELLSCVALSLRDTRQPRPETGAGADSGPGEPAAPTPTTTETDLT